MMKPFNFSDLDLIYEALKQSVAQDDVDQVDEHEHTWLDDGPQGPGYYDDEWNYIGKYSSWNASHGRDDYYRSWHSPRRSYGGSYGRKHHKTSSSTPKKLDASKYYKNEDGTIKEVKSENTAIYYIYQMLQLIKGKVLKPDGGVNHGIESDLNTMVGKLLGREVSSVSIQQLYHDMVPAIKSYYQEKDPSKRDVAGIKEIVAKHCK